MLSCQERCRVVFVLWIPCGLTAPFGFYIVSVDVAVGSSNGAAIASIARRNENTSHGVMRGYLALP